MTSPGISLTIPRAIVRTVSSRGSDALFRHPASVAASSQRRAKGQYQRRFLSNKPNIRFSQASAPAPKADTNATSADPDLQPSSTSSQPPKSRADDHIDVSSNPALNFPCLDALESKTRDLTAKGRIALRTPAASGPEPSYTTGVHKSFNSTEPLLLDWGGVLPQFTIAYETWGTLNPDKSNAILLHTGLSASSHAASTPENTKPGWWEKFIGPGRPLDTSKFFVVCTNVLGGCYGSTGPSSRDPANGQRYATRFPILTMEDMVRGQFRLLDHLGVRRLHASVGASMGGMQSLAAGVLFPHRVGRVVTISGAARSHPYSIAMRHTQRAVLMVDPNWRRGFYYPDSQEPGRPAAAEETKVPPHAGLKLAREIATVTYRSGPEWEARFGRARADPSRPPALCPDFLIETYLDHAGEKWCLEYDANSFLYISKGMDLFDLGAAEQNRRDERRRRFEQERRQDGTVAAADGEACTLSLPDTPYEEQPQAAEAGNANGGDTVATQSGDSAANLTRDKDYRPPQDLVDGLRPMKDIPALVMGVESDILFPVWQQREAAESLRAGGNADRVQYAELGLDRSQFGHDTFLLDVEGVGGPVGEFLSKP